MGVRGHLFKYEDFKDEASEHETKAGPFAGSQASWLGGSPVCLSDSYNFYYLFID